MNEPIVPQLTDAELKRLDRLGRRRSRFRPAKLPARLARTSAFAAKRRGLITDSTFERVYYVPGHSLVRVSGRELGTQHREVIYAVFRLPCRRLGPEKAGQSVMVVDTTWRTLLTAMGLTHHANNVGALHYAFEDIKKVVITVYEGKEEKLLPMWREGRLPKDKGRMGNLLQDIEWTGIGLDDRVRISYGDWTAQMVESAKLVSLNADVQFALQSDYAKSFWPYIDGLSLHTWVDEDMLAHLVGRDLWGPGETSASRGEFRKLCRKAFDDMKRAGGLVSWSLEVRGAGRKKKHRYHHVHALRQGDTQLELPMTDTAALAAAERLGG